ncbi:MAG: VWA domain-containing protein [Bacteroidales bacterium]
MRRAIRGCLRRAFVATLAVICALCGGVLVAQQQPATSQQMPRFRSAVDLVVVNVVVRDKNGNIVRGLKREDFVVTEDNRPQEVTNFDFEEIDTKGSEFALPESMGTVLGSVGKAATAPGAALPAQPTLMDLHGRRLIVMLFDVSSMQPEEIGRAFDSARDYIQKRMTPADTVALVTLSTSLHVVQDFTSDREALLGAINGLSGVEGMGFDEQAAADPGDAPADTGFTADDSEFTIFNTDRRLEALKSLANAMAGIEQKKSLVYFSSGMTQTGLDNRAAIRSVIDRAVRANVSIYAADMRGLQAMPAGGDASQASTRGQSAFTGRSTSNRFDQMAASQDALSTLAEDTGGRAFFQMNDFGGVFDRVVADTSAYYALGFTSTNPAKDGRFRRVRVQVKRADVKLEYRAGYYAPADFAHAGKEDREQQLIEQMMSDLPVTDVPVYASSAYFRMKGGRYFVPIWLVVPASRVRFARSGDKDKATIDVFGVMRDEMQRPVGRIRDTINLAVNASEGVQQKNVQYETSFELPPGSYRLKFIVRENQTGQLGAFEAIVNVPNLDRSPVKISSVVIGTQLRPGAKRDDRNPLINGNQELLANVAHVVTPAQHMLFYYELYDPAKADTASPTALQPASAQAAPPKAAAASGKDAVRVLSNVVFFKGKTKVYETRLVEATSLAAPDRKAAIFQLDVPASELAPGLYTCQVNIVDDVGGTFAFPRLALYVSPGVSK